MYMYDRFRTTLMRLITSFMSEPMYRIESLDKNDVNIFAPFYENGHVKYPVNIEEMELDFIQLMYLHEYFKRRLEIAEEALDDVKAKYGGSVPDYEWDVHTRTEEVQAILTSDWETIIIPFQRDVMRYEWFIPRIQSLILKDLRERFNIRV